MAEPTKALSKLPVTVTKPTPYTFDLGLLLASDPNPLPPSTASTIEETLSSVARDGAQALLNQLLTTCSIVSTPSGVLLTLPPPTSSIPREKPLPTPKAQTTWEKFAAKKGIKAKTKEQKKNLVYDEEKAEWVPKWGYKGKNKDAEKQWIVEVDPRKERERKEGTEVRGDGRRERVEKARRNERKMRANERAGRKAGGK